MAISAAITTPRLPLATLEPVRFGEFLRDSGLITDEQWICALADHWSAPRRKKIGVTIVEHGFLPAEVVEAEARRFHDELDVVEYGDPIQEELLARSERSTLPVPRVQITVTA